MDTEIPQYEQDLLKLKEEQQRKAVADLEEQQRKAISALEAEEQAISPAFAKQRSAVATQTQTGAKNFAEYLATRGLTSSGLAGQAETTRRAEEQRALGEIGTAEATALADIERRRTGIGEEFRAGVTSAQAGIEADYISNLLSQRNVERQFEQSDRQFTEQVRQYEQEFQFSQEQYQNAIEQQDWERAFAEKQRQDALTKQANADAIAWYNAKTSRGDYEGANTSVELDNQYTNIQETKAKGMEDTGQTVANLNPDFVIRDSATGKIYTADKMNIYTTDGENFYFINPLTGTSEKITNSSFQTIQAK